MTALSPLASAPELGAWVGQDITSSTDLLRAEAVLSAASALVRDYCGKTWATEDTPDVVLTVVVQVAARVWNNPDGLTSVTVDDGTRRWGENAGGLYLTPADKAALSAHRTGSSGGLGTISTAGGSAMLDAVYVPTGPPPSGYPFPWYDSEELWP